MKYLLSKVGIAVPRNGDEMLDFVGLCCFYTFLAMLIGGPIAFVIGAILGTVYRISNCLPGT